MRPISELPDIIKDKWGTPYGVCFTYGAVYNSALRDITS